MIDRTFYPRIGSSRSSPQSTGSAVHTPFGQHTESPKQWVSSLHAVTARVLDGVWDNHGNGSRREDKWVIRTIGKMRNFLLVLFDHTVYCMNVGDCAGAEQQTALVLRGIVFGLTR